MSPERREIARRFFPIFLGTSVLVAALGWAHYGSRLRESDRTLKAAGADTLHAVETRMREALDGVASDLRMLGRLEELSPALAWRDPGRLTREFLALGTERAAYDRIRHIDERGQETVHVDLGAGQPRVAPADPQNQSGQPFFRRAMALGPREIHVSPMELTADGGEIELPHRPLLRFATPVFDGQGSRRGVLVLDYAAARLLDAVADVPRDGPGRVSLLNRDGYWLHAPHPGDEWTFMFPERRDISFAARYPDAWRAMERTPRGDHAGPGGRFFFTTVAALTRAPPDLPREGGAIRSAESAVPAFAPGEHWKLVYHVAPQFYAGRERRELLYALGLGVLVLMLAAPWQWHAARSLVQGHQHAAAIAEGEARLARVERTAGLGHWVYHAASGEIAASEQLLRIFGFDAVNRDHGQERFARMLEDREEGHLHRLQTALATGRGYRIEYPVLRTDGSERWVRFIVAPERDRRGRVTRLFGTVHDITERRVEEEQARRIAHHDPLTGLPNRLLLGDRLSRALVQSHRNGRVVGLVCIDLDGFRQVNDRYGYPAGDALLREVAQRLGRCLRAEDTVARPGGDEFLILLPSLGAPDDAAQVAAKVLAALEEPLMLDQHRIPISCSVGIAVYPRDARSAEELLERAAQAMVHARESGSRRMSGCPAK